MNKLFATHFVQGDTLVEQCKSVNEMAVPTNLYQKASLKGDREDLTDKIYNTSPTETPVLSAIGRVTATNTYHE